MSCKPNYIWGGDSFLPAPEDGLVLRIGSGRTLCDMLNSNLTALPDGIEAYVGTDINVPANIRATDRDLVLYCGDSASILDVSVCYYDALNEVWRGPYPPKDSYTDYAKTWFVFKGYLDSVIPFRSEVRIQLAGALTPSEPDVTAQPSATDIQVIQPPEEYNIALEMSIYNDAAMTLPNVIINTADPRADFPVKLFDGSAFVDFPVEGATKRTAGNYTVVDLSNLEYADKVYIKWVWRGVESGQIAGVGSSVYPAYTATNPDNIGFVWETTM